MHHLKFAGVCACVHGVCGVCVWGGCMLPVCVVYMCLLYGVCVFCVSGVCDTCGVCVKFATSCSLITKEWKYGRKHLCA